MNDPPHGIEQLVADLRRIRAESANEHGVPSRSPGGCLPV